jgi:hypothetical protein
MNKVLNKKIVKVCLYTTSDQIPKAIVNDFSSILKLKFRFLLPLVSPFPTPSSHQPMGRDGKRLEIGCDEKLENERFE